MRTPTLLLAVAVITLVALVPGCTGPAPFSTETTTVLVPYYQSGADHEIVLESSLNRESKLGIRYMGAEAWDAAIEKLNRAVDDGDDDARTHFALGVAYELTNQYERAKTHYMIAIENAPKQVESYEIALMRINTKLGQRSASAAMVPSDDWEALAEVLGE